MQTKALETFLCVAETGGFHAAARKLNVTQTAVSARIRLIEEETGRPLFTRGAGGTALTEFGRQFKPYAEQMLSLWAFASHDLPMQAQSRPALRLGGQLSIWDPLLVDLAVRFEQRFDKLLLTLNYDHDLDMVEAVATHVLDATVTHEKPTDRRVTWRELEPEVLSLVQTPKKDNADDDLVFVNLELGEVYQDHVRSAARRASGQTLFLGNCMMALRYVLKRGGCGYFPDYVISDHLISGELELVKNSVALPLPMYLVTRSEQPEFDELRSCLADLRA
ncbi:MULTISPECIES: LysR family transcriptional regulator [unclassified Ruegeria]|uniref:LysR family transcriptional regulator n=1 Tax=unclassified Ruegeria TaxID=2625375 RepID=UPI0014894E0B|nr:MULTISPECIES: LysR family transcriptional regulator [unclassified Ruegeria]NOD75849.1 LysR family transcriptional regulator [Ruegeria sp. HKCCD4332]NOD88869.1 LysR family transcriptional regulator [Ruegeria sp. HKCCD4318]NOE14545.1 LysR family transcriptional regulator [Ruegeria sp. HKCCD4318-2]NOG09934.1 LysR family transcriptional regulator [Ruegeria sp. HKCCD4315]